jgi:uncharacterized protein (DUF58 family)
VDAVSPLTPERVLRRLEWQILRRLDGRMQGDYRTLLRGNGSDFFDLRSYEWGDDVRHIDWNVSARTDELFLREFVEDRELTAWLLIDRSRSMVFGPPERTKERVVTELAGTFAQLLVRGGNRVGALVYDGVRTQTIPPRQGRKQVLLLLDHLLRPVPGGSVTALGELLSHVERVAQRRSLVVLISDFISEPGWQRPLSRLSARHEVVAVRVVDPREYVLPDAGLLTVEDAETGEQLVIDSSDRKLRARLEALAHTQDADIRQGASDARVALHVVSTEDDLVPAFVRMAAGTRRRVR